MIMRNDCFTRITIALSFLILSSCIASENEGMVPADEADAVTFVLEDVCDFTRSSIGVDESTVKDVALFAYYDGFLLCSGYWKAGEKMTLTLDAGEEYDFYALANMGNVSLPVLEKDVRNFVYDIDGLSDMDDSFPMCWSLAGYVPDTSRKVSVQMKRLASKVALDVDCGDTGLKVTGVSLVQAPLSVCPFASDGSKAVAGKVSEGDFATSADLSVLNSGGSVCFYMFENMQGTLLPHNTDPMKKIPSMISGVSDLCTFIEVQCEFDYSSGKEGTARYRMYLGEDEMTNFDVRRNTVLNVSLCLTSDGLKVKNSWKIIPDYVQHLTDISLDRTSMGLLIGEDGVLKATVSPSDAVEVGVRWQSSDTAVATVASDGTVTGISEGKCIIRAVSKDRSEFYAECEVIVEDAVSSLEFSRSEVRKVLGYEGLPETSAFYVIASWLSGKKLNVTDGCTYSSSSSSASVTASGVVEHMSPGTARITARYEGKSAVMNVETIAFAVSAVEFEQERYVVSLGETVIVRYRVLYNDGTASNYVSNGLLNEKCWSGNGYITSDFDVAGLNDYGRVTTYADGETSVTISVRDRNSQIDYEATVPLQVNQAYLVRVYAGSPPMFYDGSGGPWLYGVYSDGTERNLTASSSWSVSNGYVTYSASAGIQVSDPSKLTEGVSLVTFTGTYRGMSASAASKYGMWVREARFLKTQIRTGVYNYKMIIVYDDHSEVAVPFTYQTSTDGSVWTAAKSASAAGVDLPSTVPATMIKGTTSSGYYDYRGNDVYWSASF